MPIARKATSSTKIPARPELPPINVQRTASLSRRNPTRGSPGARIGPPEQHQGFSGCANQCSLPIPVVTLRIVIPGCAIKLGPDTQPMLGRGRAAPRRHLPAMENNHAIGREGNGQDVNLWGIDLRRRRPGSR